MLVERVHQYLIDRSQYKTLLDYYIGKQDILYRTVSDPTMPNNRVAHNVGKLIVDTNSSYFMGSPVTYKGKERATLDKFLDVLSKNNSRDKDFEQAKLSPMTGHSWELDR